MGMSGGVPSAQGTPTCYKLASGQQLKWDNFQMCRDSSPFFIAAVMQTLRSLWAGRGVQSRPSRRGLDAHLLS